MEDLKSIFVEGRTVNIGGTEILVKSFCVQDIPTAVEMAEKYVQIIGSDDTSNMSLLKAITKEWESVKYLIEITTDLNKEDIPRLNSGAALLILREVIKENLQVIKLENCYLKLKKEKFLKI